MRLFASLVLSLVGSAGVVAADCPSPRFLQPGHGLGTLVLGKSKPEDVMRIYKDCALKREAGRVVDIDCESDRHDKYVPDRAGAEIMPTHFKFKRGVLASIEAKNRQEGLITVGNVRVGYTRAQLTRLLGDGARTTKGKSFDDVAWSGVLFSVHNSDDTVFSITIVPPGLTHAPVVDDLHPLDLRWHCSENLCTC